MNPIVENSIGRNLIFSIANLDKISELCTSWNKKENKCLLMLAICNMQVYESDVRSCFYHHKL